MIRLYSSTKTMVTLFGKTLRRRKSIKCLNTMFLMIEDTVTLLLLPMDTRRSVFIWYMLANMMGDARLELLQEDILRIPQWKVSTQELYLFVEFVLSFSYLNSMTCRYIRQILATHFLKPRRLKRFTSLLVENLVISRTTSLPSSAVYMDSRPVPNDSMKFLAMCYVIWDSHLVLLNLTSG